MNIKNLLSILTHKKKPNGSLRVIWLSFIDFHCTANKRIRVTRGMV